MIHTSFGEELSGCFHTRAVEDDIQLSRRCRREAFWSLRLRKTDSRREYESR